jgi:CxxC motif-containing protein (DUF1111 family)
VLPVATRPDVLGGVIHAAATRPDLMETIQQVSVRFPVIPGGIKVSNGCVTQSEDFNPVVQSRINTPALFGAGLIDEISGFSIHGEGIVRSAKAVARELEADFTGVPVGQVRALSRGRVGKFGWKGQFATLEEFVATACAVELGLTNPQKSQIVPGEFRENPDAALDMTSRQLDELVTYVAALPRPVEILPDDPDSRAQAVRGKVVFVEAGCADCHTPNIGGIEGIYSDFRLYEVEPERAPGYSVQSTPAVLPHGHPEASMWKTPPLWGVADSAPYFHDGGSPTLSHAILRHQGSAKKSRDKFKHLKPPDREALFAFLDTLRAPK